MTQKKILVIDGGGIKGVFPASFLSSIEKKINGNLSEYFDLIVGTSTGGIIALGIGLGFTAEELLDFYKVHGEKIFAGNRLVKFFRHFVFSKYDQNRLKQALQETFGDKKIADSKNRLVIPSFDLGTGNVYIYKTAHHKRFTTDFYKSAVDVALSTSAAPTFFPAHLLPSGAPLIDGGIYANNPIGLAVVEAVGILKWNPDSLRILSIGCTSSPIGKRRFGKGKAYWMTRITDLFLRSQSSLALGIAACLTSHSQIYRIDPLIPAEKFELDNYRAIPSLEGLGETYAREHYPKIESFFIEKTEPFEPYHNLKTMYS